MTGSPRASEPAEVPAVRYQRQGLGAGTDGPFVMFPRPCRPWVVRAIEERNVYGLDTIWQIVIISSPETDSAMRHANRQAASSLEKVPPLLHSPGSFDQGLFCFWTPMNTCSLAAMFGQAWPWPLVLQALALETLSGTINRLARPQITSRSPCSRGPPPQPASPMRRFGACFPTGPPQGPPKGWSTCQSTQDIDRKVGVQPLQPPGKPQRFATPPRIPHLQE